ncbi:MAG: hypothetical protein JNM31_10810 [Flavobacteriales bacterium]|nr:hypothetical protein [Flavobacteriales bacterium]
MTTVNDRRTLLALAATAATLLTIAANAQDQNTNDCIVRATSKWGEPCERCEVYKDGFRRDFEGTYQVEFQNVCRDFLEVKVAVQERNGTWRTFPVKVLGPQERFSAFACQGTGKYVYWSRRMNDAEIVLPSDQMIAGELRSR